MEVNVTPDPKVLAERPLLDLEQFDAARAALKDRFGSLVELYRTDSQRLTKELVAALRAGVLADVVFVSHTIKSSSRTLGALRAAAFAEAIEHQARRMADGPQDIPALARLGVGLGQALTARIA